MTNYRLGENICKLHANKGLISKIYNESKNLTGKKKAIRKEAKDMNRNFTKKDLQMANKLIK